MPFEVNHHYELPFPLHLVADLQQPQAMESAKTFLGCEIAEILLYILAVTSDEPRDAQDEQTAEANKSRHRIDTTIAVSVKLFLDT
jgi:hypothetical protein